MRPPLHWRSDWGDAYWDGNLLKGWLSEKASCRYKTIYLVSKITFNSPVEAPLHALPASKLRHLAFLKIPP